MAGQNRDALVSATLRHAVRMGDNPIMDFRRLVSDPAILREVGRSLWALARSFEPAVLVGPGFGAAPLLSSMAFAALEEGVTVSTLMVRDKRKGHHQKRWVEGRPPSPGLPAVIVDDFIERGSALDLVEQALKADGIELRIRAICVLFDMWPPLGSRQISVARQPLHSVLKRHDLGLTRDAFDARPPLMKGAYPDFIDKPRWWRFDLNTNDGHSLKCSPVVTGGTVVTADDRSVLWGHDPDTGDILWRRESLAQPRKAIDQLLQAVAGSIVYGCYDGTLTRVDAGSGDVLWRWRLDSSIHATPWIDEDNERLFINTEQYSGGRPLGHLHCLNLSSGRVVWTHAHGYWPPGSPAYCPRAGLVVSTCNDETVVAVSADTGDLGWKQRSTRLVRGRPIIADGRVFYATETGHLVARDLMTGRWLWSVRYGTPGWHQFLLVRDGCVVVLDGKGHLVGFDTHDGAIRWMTRLRSPGAWCPVVLGPWMIILSRQGHFAVIDTRSCQKVWEGSVDGRSRQPPALGDAAGRAWLAVATADAGLKLFDVHPFYAQRSPLEAAA